MSSEPTRRPGRSRIGRRFDGLLGTARGASGRRRSDTEELAVVPRPDPTLRGRIEDVRRAADGLLGAHDEPDEGFIAALQAAVRLAGFELDVQVHAPRAWPNFLMVDRFRAPGEEAVAAFVPDQRTDAKHWLVYVPLGRVAAVA